MRKLGYIILQGALIITLSGSCSSEDPDTIWDISPLVISVKVVSTDGYSVLNASNTPQITATFRGKTYACSRKTRYYMPQFFGLVFSNDYLLFGELNGDDNYSNEQLTINWGDGSPADVITFNHKVEWKHNKPHFKQSFFLNGKCVEGQITIQKDLKTTDSDTPRVDIPLSNAQLVNIYAVNRMGFNLFQQMLAEPTADGHSIVVSPLNVAFALGMLADGAPTASETCQQLLRVLNGLNGTDKVNIMHTDHDQLFKQLIDYAPIVDGGVDAGFANAFIARKGTPIYSGYVSLLADYYQADYMLLDFASSTAVNEINAWCRQKTKGLISSIINKIYPSYSTYWINAFYFKGGWPLLFNRTNSSVAPFTLPDGSQTDLKMMHSRMRSPFVNLDAANILALPFNQGAYEMDIVLSNEGHAFKDVINVLADNPPSSWVWQVDYVDITMPVFYVESLHDNLSKYLQLLGVTRVFTSDAEFTEISPDEGLLISMMKQAARISIDEDGCNGGTSTINTQDMPNNPSDGPDDKSEFALADDLPSVTFNVNRPFLYLIREVSSGAILLIGTYCGEQRIEPIIFHRREHEEHTTLENDGDSRPTLVNRSGWQTAGH